MSGNSAREIKRKLKGIAKYGLGWVRGRNRTTATHELSMQEVLQQVRLHSDTGAPHVQNWDQFVAHLTQRCTPAWPDLPTNLTDLRLDINNTDEREVIERAEKVLANDLFGRNDGSPILASDGKIDWHKSPNGSREWHWRLHRHQWWVVLAHAYKITGDDRYATAFVEQLCDWLDNNPRLQEKDETSPAWRLMEVALRLRMSWLPVYGVFQHCARFDVVTRARMIKSVYEHADFLYRFRSKLNHLVRESVGLLCASLYFPEFVPATSWRDQALQLLAVELHRQINDDGSHIEMSVGYQFLAIDEFEAALDLVEVFELPEWEAGFRNEIVKMYGFLAGVIRPDGTFPEKNDGFLLWTRNRIERAAHRFYRPDLAYAASLGEGGDKPAEDSIVFEDAGVFVMRSGWTREDSWLLFDCGPHGGFHGHEDMLSIELFANGQLFVGDPGSYTYDKNDPFRAYFVGSHSHNTVLVDGKSQARRWQLAHAVPARASGPWGKWLSTPQLDAASGAYSDGYGRLNTARGVAEALVEDVSHERHVLFVKSGYWLVIDGLSGANEHRFDLLYHAPPDVDMTIAAQNTVRLENSAKSAALQIQVKGTAQLNLSVVRGADTPIQGWWSLNHHHKAPSNTLVAQAEPACRMLFVTLIAVGPDYSLQQTSPTSDGESGWQISGQHGLDLLQVSSKIAAQAGNDKPQFMNNLKLTRSPSNGGANSEELVLFDNVRSSNEM